MVRGVTLDLLLGQDAHQNRLLAVAGDQDSALAGSVDASDLGWAGVLTVDSSVKNVNAAGEDRVNIQSADESALTGVQGITSKIAQAIVAYRRQHQFQSIADLLDVTPPQNQNQSGGSSGSGDGGGGGTGNKVVGENLFMDIADDVTVDTGDSLAGAININTASLEVLVCLPGVSRELAQAIISQRQSAGFFASTGELLKVPDLTRDIFQQIAPLITARSETYRHPVRGKDRTPAAARQRIQAIVHVDLNSIRTRFPGGRTICEKSLFSSIRRRCTSRSARTHSRCSGKMPAWNCAAGSQTDGRLTVSGREKLTMALKASNFCS